MMRVNITLHNYMFVLLSHDFKLTLHLISGTNLAQSIKACSFKLSVIQTVYEIILFIKIYTVEMVKIIFSERN